MAFKSFIFNKLHCVDTGRLLRSSGFFGDGSFSWFGHGVAVEVQGFGVGGFGAVDGGVGCGFGWPHGASDVEVQGVVDGGVGWGFG